MILFFATIVCFHSVYLELIPADFRAWLFVVIMAGFGLCPFKMINKNIKKIIFFPMCALVLILSIEYARMILNLIDYYQTSWLIISLTSFASIWFVLLMQQNTIASIKIKCGMLLLTAAHLLAIMAFYQLTHRYNSLAVSASWLIYAFCVILFAFKRKDSVMAKSALLILSLAAAKALLYDAASAPTIVRILCLLVTGVVLYGSGFLLRQFGKWK